MGSSAKNTVLFLCIGNSCRSQMAEALTNHFASESWTAFSGGTEPEGFVHPTALKVLEEINVQHQGKSKSVEEFKGQAFDLVITVCDQAEEQCPVWLGSGKKIHRSFKDPAAVAGGDKEILQAFRAVRNQIQEAIPILLSQYQLKD